MHTDTELTDRTLDCIDCHYEGRNPEFIWTVSEQVFFREHGYQHPPKRCVEHRRRKRDQRPPMRYAGV